MNNGKLKFILNNTETYKWIFIASLSISLFVLLRWINFPVSDFYGFRQAQTALSALFILDDFNLFKYQTPVLGYPWSIPFEFPIYQLIVALLAKITNWDLTVCGRVVSWSFYILTLYPIYKISIKLTEDERLFYIISSLYLISPIYLFWSRTFMIETMTVFFASMFLYYFMQIIDRNKFIDFILCFIFSILCIMSKATTYPAFVLAGMVYFYYIAIKNKKIDFKVIAEISIIVIISLVVVCIWVHHTDILKSENLLGSYFTSKKLITWNYGTVQQRFSWDFYNDILFHRIFPYVLGNLFIIIPILGAFISVPKNYKKIFGLFLMLFCFPIAIFSNLYYSHIYYFAANSIFLLAGLGILIYGLLKCEKFKTAFFIFILLLLMMLFSFPTYIIKKSANNNSYAVGRYIKNNTAKNSAIIVLGHDWNSEDNYYSERKGIAVPDFIYDYTMDELLKNLDIHTGDIPVSAVIYHPTKNIRITNLKDKILLKYPKFKKHIIKGIVIYSITQ